MLKGLKVNIAELGRNMERNFEELKSFFVGRDFDEKVLKQINYVWTLMLDAAETQSKRALNAFIYEYKKDYPRHTLLKFVVGLDIESQNPIKAAMNSQVFKSRAILDRYLQLLSHLIFKVYAIEGFYYGLDYADNKDNNSTMDEIAKEMDAIMRRIQGFVAGYKMETTNYWPARIEEEVVKYLDEDAHSSNATNKAAWIHELLEGVHTTDVFAIYAYTEHTVFVYKRDPTLWSTMPTVDVDRRLRDHIDDDPYHSKLSFTKVTENDGVKTHVIVMRSTKFHTIGEAANRDLRMSYRGFGTANYLRREKKITDEASYYSATEKSFLEERASYFDESYMLHGFMVGGPPTDVPVARFTNNGYSILNEAELDVNKLPYHGIIWV